MPEPRTRRRPRPGAAATGCDVLPGLARGLGPAWREGSGLGTPPVFPRPCHKKCRLQQACRHRPQCRFFFFRSERLLTPTPRAVVKKSQTSRTVCEAPQPVPPAPAAAQGTPGAGRGPSRKSRPRRLPSARVWGLRLRFPLPRVSAQTRLGKKGQCFRGPLQQGRGQWGTDAPRKTNLCLCSVAVFHLPDHC